MKGFLQAIISFLEGVEVSGLCLFELEVEVEELG